MTADTRRLLVVFAILVTLIGAPFLITRIRDSRRPVLAGARVVTATGSDPVFRTGRRHVAPGDTVEAALALHVERAGRGRSWLAPVHELAIDGEPVAHDRSGTWPDSGRTVRVFWFSVESSTIGGVLTADNAGERLRYRTFFAPEMGRELRALRLPETHNDDSLGTAALGAPGNAGTVRLYARAEIVEEADDLRPLHAATTLEPALLLDERFPTLLRAADLGAGVRSEAGELFGLPGFEPEGPTPEAREDTTVGAFGRRFTDLVAERVVVSSWTLAAVATTGSPRSDPAGLADLGELAVTDDSLRRAGRAAVWGPDVRAGDLLVDGERWLVLLGDNGNGELDPSDPVLRCWGRPPERTTVLAALGPATVRVGHRRVRP